MKIWMAIGMMCISSVVFAQKVSNFIMYNKEGVTQNFKKATDFIVVKEYPEHHFARLDYKAGGPLKKYRTYKDTAMQVLDGPYCEYAPDGWMTTSGNFKDNKKDGRWYTFQNASMMTSVLWSQDSVVSVDNLHRKDSSIAYPDEKEAGFPGGKEAWRKYIVRCMEKPNKIKIGGNSVVAFAINTDGTTIDVYLRKSSTYLLDEQALEAIRESPKWKPAFQNGKNVKAYRIQPFVYRVQR